MGLLLLNQPVKRGGNLAPSRNSQPTAQRGTGPSIALTIFRAGLRDFFGTQTAPPQELSHIGTELAASPNGFGAPGRLSARFRGGTYLPDAPNMPACAPPGGSSPRWRHPASLGQRPRAVRASRPSWIR